MHIEHASVMVEGRPVRGVIATCKCGVLKSVPINVVTATPGEQDAKRDVLVGRKLETFGWRVLKPKDGHQCPACVATYQSKHSSPVIVKDFKDMRVNNAHFAGPSEPPAELTRENRRIILAKLEDVYVDEKVGYGPGWTDAKVALDLGVPRAWVKTLRTENFGPEGNEDSRKALEEARQLLADSAVLTRHANEIITQLTTMNRRNEKIERTIIEIEKGLRA